MAQSRNSRSRSTSKSTSASSRGRSTSSRGTYNRSSSSRKSTSRQSQSALTTDQKLNFIGGLLLVVGVLSLVALFTSKNGALTGWVAKTTAQIAGVGGFIIPIALIIFGLYLVLRKFEKLPHISGGRSAGIILMYFNLLGWFHVFNKGGLEAAQAGKGGGLIGAGIDSLLKGSLGNAGEIVFLGAWFLIALIFIIDISLPELVTRIGMLFQRKTEPAYAVAKQRPLTHIKSFYESAPDSDLPEGFNRLNLDDDEGESLITPPRRESHFAGCCLPVCQPNNHFTNCGNGFDPVSIGKDWRWQT